LRPKRATELDARGPDTTWWSRFDDVLSEAGALWELRTRIWNWRSLNCAVRSLPASRSIAAGCTPWFSRT